MNMSRLFAYGAVGATLILPVCFAQTGFSTLYNFTGQNGDGGQPVGTLAIDKSGALYGTTASGGSGPCNVTAVPAGCGTVFELRPLATAGGAWTETVLYRFMGQNGDGWSPYGGVVIGKNGRLYGTTLYGGTGCSTWGCGTVFELRPPVVAGGAWTENVICSFTGQNGDGATPVGSLAIGKYGDLYGLTTAGGTSNYGAVYRLTPPVAAAGAWTETVLHSFAVRSFNLPQGYPSDMSLKIGDGGALYGATAVGGQEGYGMVFRLSPPEAPSGIWTETELFSFNYGDGSGPSGGVTVGSNGTLYGSTFSGGTGDCAGDNGCGAVFELTPPAAPGDAWQEAVICDFGTSCVFPQGAYPETNVVLGKDGVVYGTAFYVLFALQPPVIPGGNWTGIAIEQFDGGSGGVQPSGLAISDGGVIFGTTLQGGLCNYCGTVFRWAPFP
jgi:hypothetical protein